MKSVLVGLLLTFLGATQVLAADVYKRGAVPDGISVSEPDSKRDWNGPYVAVGVGYHSLDAWGEIGGTQFTPDFAATGFVAMGRIGYDFQFGRTVAGVFGEINYSDLEFAGKSIDDVDFGYCGGARAGVVASSALIYVNGGYCWVPTDFAGFDLEGPFLGGGVETQIGGGFTVGVEGRHTWLTEEIAPSVDVNANVWTGMLIVSKRF